MYDKFGKRLFDLSLAFPALIILLPLFALIGVLVRLKLGTPILFRQWRPGLHGQPFIIFKFRTLTNARDANGKLLPDSARLTPFGHFLRRTSLDELPELFNVLKGDMSLVGPRPLLMTYLNRYTPEQMRRHEVRPGITGWAQVNGRNTLKWAQKLTLDVWYVDHRSLTLDLKIILTTLWMVLSREGISHPGHVSMAEFEGTPGNGASGEPAFSPEFKAQVVLEVLSGVKSAVDTCREYNLKPQLLARWQADFLENAARAFQNDS